MSRSLIERRLVDVTDRLKQLRRDLDVAEEQLAQVTAEADDARLRSLVSETPLAEREHREAQRQAEAIGRGRADLLVEIERAEQLQDELLDRLTAAVAAGAPGARDLPAPPPPQEIP